MRKKYLTYKLNYFFWFISFLTFNAYFYFFLNKDIKCSKQKIEINCQSNSNKVYYDTASKTCKMRNKYLFYIYLFEKELLNIRSSTTLLLLKLFSVYLKFQTANVSVMV